MHHQFHSQFPLISSQTYSQNSNQQNVNWSNKKKISTPALLFCKFGQKEISINSVNSAQKDFKSKENSSRLISNNRSPLRMQPKNNFLQNSSMSQNYRQSSSMIENESYNFPTDLNNQSRSNCNLEMNNSANSRISRKSIKESLNFCENHQNKMATYISNSQNDQTFYYCQKCAILLASKGFVISKIQDISRDLFGSRRSVLKQSKISQNQSSSKSNYICQSKKSQKKYNLNPRESEVQTFLQQTKDLIGKINDKKLQVKENLIQSQEFYGQQIQEINQYFQLVYQTLQLQKNKCYNYILNQRKQVQQPVRHINETIQQLKNKINSIVSDIQENIQTVFAAEENVYRLVIEQYADNYRQVENKITNLTILPIQMIKINFQGVPDSIFQLSDLLKNSIKNTGLMQNSVKMQQQLQSLRESMKQNNFNLQPKNLFSKNCKMQLYFSFQGESLKAAIAQSRQNQENQDYCYEEQ